MNRPSRHHEFPNQMASFGQRQSCWERRNGCKRMGRCRPRLNCTQPCDPFAAASSHTNCAESHRRLGGGPGDWDANPSSQGYRSKSVHDPWDVDCESNGSHTLCGRGPIVQCRNLDMFNRQSYRSNCDNSCPYPSLERSVFRSNVCKIEKASFPINCNTPSHEMESCCRSCGGPLETRTCGVSMTLDLSICPRCMPQVCAFGTPVSHSSPTIQKLEPLAKSRSPERIDSPKKINLTKSPEISRTPDLVSQESFAMGFAAPVARVNTIGNRVSTIGTKTSNVMLSTASVGTQGHPIINTQDAQTSYSNISGSPSNILQELTSPVSHNDAETDYEPYNYSQPTSPRFSAISRNSTSPEDPQPPNESYEFENRSTEEFDYPLSPTRLSSISPSRSASVARNPRPSVAQDPVTAYSIPRPSRPSPVRQISAVTTSMTPLPSSTHSRTSVKEPLSRSRTFQEDPVVRKSFASRPVSQIYEESPLERKSIARPHSQTYLESPLPRKSISRTISQAFHEDPVVRKSIAPRPVSQIYEESPLERKSIFGPLSQAYVESPQPRMSMSRTISQAFHEDPVARKSIASRPVSRTYEESLLPRKSMSRKFSQSFHENPAARKSIASRSVSQTYEESPLERKSIARALSQTYEESPLERKSRMSIASRPVSEPYEESPLARWSTVSLKQPSKKSLSLPVTPSISRQSIAGPLTLHRMSSISPEGHPGPARQSIAIALKHNGSIDEPPVFTKSRQFSIIPELKPSISLKRMSTVSSKRPSRLSVNPVRDHERSRLSVLPKHDSSLTHGLSPKALVLERLSQVLGIHPEGRSSEETIHNSGYESLSRTSLEEPLEPSLYAREMAEINKGLLQGGIRNQSQSFVADYDGRHLDPYVLGRTTSGQDDDSLQHERRKRRKERKRHHTFAAEELRKKEEEYYKQQVRRDVLLSRGVSPNRIRKQTRFRSNSASRDEQKTKSSRRRGGAGMETDDLNHIRSNMIWGPHPDVSPPEAWNIPNSTEVYDQYIEEPNGNRKSSSEVSLHEGDPLPTTSRQYVDPDLVYGATMAEEYGYTDQEYGQDAGSNQYYEPSIGNVSASFYDTLGSYQEVAPFEGYEEYVPLDEFGQAADQYEMLPPDEFTNNEYYDQNTGNDFVEDAYDGQYDEMEYGWPAEEEWCDRELYAGDCGCNECPVECRATLWDYLSAVWIPKQEYALAMIAIAILMMLICLTSQVLPFIRAFFKPSKCIRWFG